MLSLAKIEMDQDILALLSSPKIKLFYHLLRIRKIEEAIAARHQEQQMRCPVHLSTGQEAVSVGICDHLTPSDYAMSTHRSHAHYLGKGGSLPAMLAEFYGKETGCAKGRGGSMHLIDLRVGFLGCVPIVASTIPIGVGAAFGGKLQGKKNITVIFLGDGATEEGVFYESLNFAKLHNLPVLFVCENNLYSITTPLQYRRSPETKLLNLVNGFGVESYSMDGQNCFTVNEKVEPLIKKLRQGSGPIFLECNTFRFLENCGPHSDAGLRSEKEIEEWVKKDPVKLGHSILIHEEMMDEKGIEHLHFIIQKEIDEAFDFAIQSSFPKSAELQHNVYS